jgi:hypothetical protein
MARGSKRTYLDSVEEAKKELGLLNKALVDMAEETLLHGHSPRQRNRVLRLLLAETYLNGLYALLNYFVKAADEQSTKFITDLMAKHNARLLATFAERGANDNAGSR